MNEYEICEMCEAEVENPPTAWAEDETMRPMALCDGCRKDAAFADCAGCGEPENAHWDGGERHSFHAS